MRDSHGNPIANAHLLGLFRRVCKLLFYRIRPVFVFDGSVPALKKQTLAARRQRKIEAADSSTRASEKLVHTMLRHHALRTVLGQTSGEASPKKTNNKSDSEEPHSDLHLKGSSGPDLFSLPPLPSSSLNQEENYEDEDHLSSAYNILYDAYQNLNDIDVDAKDFQNLPPDVRHEILMELKLNRKEHSWSNIGDLPQQSDDFSSYQVKKLMRQNKLSQKIECVRKELNNQVSGEVATAIIGGIHGGEVEARRIISDDSSHYILIKGLNKDQQQKLVEGQIEEDNSEHKPLEETQALEIKSENPNFNEKKKTVIELLDSDGEVDEVNVLASSKDVKEKDKKNIVSSQKIEPEFVFAAIKECANSKEPSEDSVGKEGAFVVYDGENFTGEGGFIRDDGSDSDVEVIQQNEFSKDSRSKKQVLEMPLDPDSSTTDNSIHEIEFRDTTEAVDHKKKDHEEDIKQNPSKEEIQDLTSSHTQQNNKIHSKDFMDIAQRLIENVPLLPEDFPSPAKDNLQSEHAKLLVETEGEAIALVGEKRPRVGDQSVIGVTPGGKIPRMVKDDAQKSVVDISDDESLDNDDMIEITINPQDAKPDDELFPADIFANPVLLNKSGSVTDNSTDIVIDEYNDHQMEAQVTITPTEEISTVPVVNEFEGLSQEELVELGQELAVEGETLRSVRGQQERLAASITDQMSIEAQDLLRLFGVPFLVSPTEAEAQCAFLDTAGMTHGTITDDSDIWLFGGQRVFKNFFNQDKYVEFYRAADIKGRMMLDRDRLINLALLCGSDYTEGVEGVGPVTAMEVFAEFLGRGSTPLIKLKEWWDEAQKQDVAPVETKLRGKLRNLKLKPGFPSQLVVDAYLSPTVDESKEPFTWASPDLDLLRDYAKEKFGWGKDKADEVLLPVIRQFHNTQKQTHITSFFNVDLGPPVALKSKRVNRILTLLKNKSDSVDLETGENTQPAENDDTPSKSSSRSNGGQRGKRERGQGRKDVAMESKFVSNSYLNTNVKQDTEVSERGRGKGKGHGKVARGRGKCKVTQGKRFPGPRKAAAKEVILSESSSESD